MSNYSYFSCSDWSLTIFHCARGFPICSTHFRVFRKIIRCIQTNYNSTYCCAFTKMTFIDGDTKFHILSVVMFLRIYRISENVTNTITLWTLFVCVWVYFRRKNNFFECFCGKVSFHLFHSARRTEQWRNDAHRDNTSYIIYRFFFLCRCKRRKIIVLLSDFVGGVPCGNVYGSDGHVLYFSSAYWCWQNIRFLIKM